MSGRNPPKSVNPIFNPKSFNLLPSQSASVYVDTDELTADIENINTLISNLGTIYTYDIFSPFGGYTGGTSYNYSIVPAFGSYLLYIQLNVLGISSADFTIGSFSFTDSTGGATFPISYLYAAGTIPYNNNIPYLVTLSAGTPAIVLSFTYNYVTPAAGTGMYYLNAPPTPALGNPPPVASIRLMRFA